eukprot:tig00001038_g6520.t1
MASCSTVTAVGREREVNLAVRVALEAHCSRWTLRFHGRPRPRGRPRTSTSADGADGQDHIDEELHAELPVHMASRDRDRLRDSPLERRYATANAASRVLVVRWVSVLAIIYLAVHAAVESGIFALAQLFPVPFFVALIAVSFNTPLFCHVFDFAATVCILLLSVSQRSLYEFLVTPGVHHVSIACNTMLWIINTYLGLVLWAARGPAALVNWSWGPHISCALSGAIATAASYVRDRGERRLFLLTERSARAAALADRDAAAGAWTEKEASRDESLQISLRITRTAPGDGVGGTPAAASVAQLQLQSISSRSGLQEPVAAADAGAGLASIQADLPPHAALIADWPLTSASTPLGSGDGDPAAIRSQEAGDATGLGGIAAGTMLTLAPVAEMRRSSRSPRLARQRLSGDPWPWPLSSMSPQRSQSESPVEGASAGESVRSLSLRSLQLPSRSPSAVSLASAQPLLPALRRPPAPMATSSPATVHADPDLDLETRPAAGIEVELDYSVVAVRERMRRRFVRAMRWLFLGDRLEPPELESRYKVFFHELAWQRVRLFAGPLTAAYFLSVLGSLLLLRAEDGSAAPVAGYLSARASDLAFEIGVCGTVQVLGVITMHLRPRALVRWVSWITAAVLLLTQVAALTSLRRIVSVGMWELRQVRKEMWTKLALASGLIFLPPVLWVPTRGFLACSAVFLPYAAVALFAGVTDKVYLLNNVSAYVGFFVCGTLLSLATCSRLESVLRRRFLLEVDGVAALAE